jgi:hypothetical protein
MHRLIVVAFTLLLTGCISPKQPGNDTLLVNIPAGSILTLHGSLPVSTGKRVALQNGRHVHQSALDKWRPYCEVVVTTESLLGSYIPRGDYRINRVARHVEPFKRVRKKGRHMVASTATNLSTLYNSHHLPWLFETTLDVEPGDDIYVKRFVCGQARDGYQEHRLSVLQFKQAVGNLISIDQANPGRK